ncbi:MAG TPA: NAD-dependent epimerase/dehydratase family protein, partial [Saprospiraceae bacterium]|nr:NAD-dependent epimerase/dehydratase family protein [Saprospiraceae bacterium]
LPSVRKVLFVSTLAAKGPADFTDRPLSMEDEDLPGTPYGRSKLMGEKRLKEHEGFQHIILRPTAIYGPRETKMLQLPKIMKRGLEPDFAPSGQKVSFIHVYDFCRLAFDALESDHADKTYLVTDGHAYEMSLYRSIIRDHLDIKPIRLRIPPKFLLESVRWINRLAKSTGQIMHTTPEKIRDVTALNWTVDLSPLEEDYGFRAQYPLEKGLPHTLDWYQKKGWL